MRLSRLALLSLAAPLPALAQAPGGLPDQPLIPRLESHARPAPFPIPAPFEPGAAPVFNPWRQDRIRPEMPVLRPLAEGSQAVRLGAGLAGAGEAREAFGQGVLRQGPLILNGALARRDIGGYTDGAGREVRLGYDRVTANAGAAWFPGEGRGLRLGFVHDDISGLRMPLARPVVENGVPLVAGAGADPLTTARTALRFGAETPLADGLRLRLDGGAAHLEREADNFSLRPAPAANRLRSEIAADVLDTRLMLEGRAWRLGVEARHESRDGRRFGGPGVGSLALLTGRQAPDVARVELAAFAEAAVPLWQGGQLALALRLGHAAAEAGGAGDGLRIGNFAGTPLSLWRSYFAGADDSTRHTAPSALLRLDHAFAGGPALHLSAGRIARMPAIEELFFALPSAEMFTAQGTPSRQVGNPTLRPEIHHRVEAGLAWQGEGWAGWARPPAAIAPGLDATAWRFALTGFAAQVEDFISRDRARGQAGVARADFAAIWRNVDAALAGVEADLQWNATRNLALRANAAFAWGENLSEDRALYGVAPFEANLLAEWHDRLGDAGRWSVGGKLRLVAAQRRADMNPLTGSGYDVAKSKGFATLDLFVTLQVNERLGLQLGVENLTDTAFAEHLPWRTTDDANLDPVRAPGRFVWARAILAF